VYKRQVQLFLNVLDHQVAHQEPGQSAGEEQADHDNACGGRQEAESEGQLASSSSL